MILKKGTKIYVLPNKGANSFLENQIGIIPMDINTERECIYAYFPKLPKNKNMHFSIGDGWYKILRNLNELVTK